MIHAPVFHFRELLELLSEVSILESKGMHVIFQKKGKKI